MFVTNGYAKVHVFICGKFFQCVGFGVEKVFIKTNSTHFTVQRVEGLITVQVY